MTTRQGMRDRILEMRVEITEMQDEISKGDVVGIDDAVRPNGAFQHLSTAWQALVYAYDALNDEEVTR